MNKVNSEIRDQFEYFEELLHESKIVLDNEIQLNSKKNNPYWLIGECSIQHNTCEDEIFLIVEKSNRDNKYGIKLRCVSLTKTPFFRFDSDGPAHRNDDPAIPLENQLVTTPHFNSFDKNGKSIAYKNEALERPEDAKVIINDIDFGTSLFCMETNSMLVDKNFPKIVYSVPEINFEETKDTNFDSINFE